MLADACHQRDVHLTTFASGCIYQYDDEHPINGGVGFKEEDVPNFDGSFYSNIRVKAECMLKEYPNVLVLRMRMPIVSDLACERNFITKILVYPKVKSNPNRIFAPFRSHVQLILVPATSPFTSHFLFGPQIISIPNSMSVLPELLPIAITLSLRRLAGPINFTNPGAISHNEILELCREYVYPDLTWSNFSVEEQNKILKAPRSNNTLDTSKVCFWILLFGQCLKWSSISHVFIGPTNPKLNHFLDPI
jgi:3,5-epimerase/4-reductase